MHRQRSERRQSLQGPKGRARMEAGAGRQGPALLDGRSHEVQRVDSRLPQRVRALLGIDEGTKAALSNLDRALSAANVAKPQAFAKGEGRDLAV